jgi:hypothetical protein
MPSPGPENGAAFPEAGQLLQYLCSFYRNGLYVDPPLKNRVLLQIIFVVVGLIANVISPDEGAISVPTWILVDTYMALFVRVFITPTKR